MDIRFYKCEHCGNIAIKVVDQGPELVCCGDKMTLLIPDTVDAATEKHIPVVEIEDGKVSVNVGSVDHPMTPEHLIEFICLVTDRGYTVHPLTAEDKPHSDFVLAEGEKPLRVYEYCNIHGLWVKEL